jgi:hypothetical protein
MAVCVNYLDCNPLWPRKVLEITLNVGKYEKRRQQ